MKPFYKLIYYLRKKCINLFLLYQRNELNVLFGNRVFIHPSVSFTEFPVLNIDQSYSRIVIEQGVLIRGKMCLLAYSDGEITIGEQSFFNESCSINCLCKIDVGSNCMFGENVKIYDHNHRFSESGKLIKEQGYSTGAIKIGNNTWIGANCVILKGANIGDNCVIGAGCIIKTNIEPNCIVSINQDVQITQRIIV